MSWNRFEEECELCFQSVELALPTLRDKYAGIRVQEVFHTLGKDKILGKSIELHGNNDALVDEIARMYEECASGGQR